MLIKIPALLSRDEVNEFRQVLVNSDWVDGSVTTGYQSAKVKNNYQLPENSEAAQRLGDRILSALARNAKFMSAALPLRIYPPMFNCYEGGGNFGVHVDNAIRQVAGTPVKVRTDVSMTVFFSDPDEYQGGELVIEDTYGSQSVKFQAGDAVLYPSTSLHQVMPVTAGRRLASFFWIQSMIRSDEQRRLLFDMDTSLQNLQQQNADNPELVKLTGVYHNLVRQWAEV